MAHNSNNVRRRLRAHAFALAAGLAAAPFAHAVCDPSDAALAAMTSVAVDFPLDDAGALLGLDGSRIKSSDLDDPLRVTLDGRARPTLWAEQVDWSAYRLPGKRVGPTTLFFDQAADGTRHLCRVEQNGFTDAFEDKREALLTREESDRYAYDRRHGGAGNRAADARAAEPGDYRLERKLVLHYDSAGRLAGFDTFSRDRDTDERTPPAQASRVCLRYDAHGWLAASGADVCDGRAGDQAGLVYVHDADGRLLRVIRREDGAVQVRTFDAQGKPGALYLASAGPKALPHRLPEIRGAYTYSLSDREQRTLVLDGPSWTIPPVDSDDYAWRFLLLPGDESAGGIIAFRDDELQLLAAGKSGRNGAIRLSAAQKRRIWEAARDRPGRVIWNYAPGQDLVVVAAMPDAVWRQCAGASDRTPDACGKAGAAARNP
ncbi:hypothetical protein [Burkholderia ubonensis]|uniref:hypothetical protein n=1 Tax=Burkholderia ubonensis TaxID=101571 RepID=UPI0007533737|nr:hypothetical protein [Burkholderia ubonensis]KVG72298.1 hypothetical protein WJ34_19740 [Burkholderia ubonensis]KVH18017.1 hypothetical protein WJ37_24240 [Burkholderia ubonensis]KVH41361.1 hypothetical protein WJ38_30695 [Burkholderia ubonensis]KVH85466.1 hypothetical protein WJ43_11245 [Burkholderia ubonensis]KVM33710.1 hypothetical protein WJ55_14990 [Burkholderia ubonensis]